MELLAPQPVVLIGVGFDTARYGHHVTFLREDRQPATKPFRFAESREGYQRLQAVFEQLKQKHGQVHFHIRIDAAGQYALNLERFLRALPIEKTITVGEPKRNRDYRNAHFPKRKADPVDSHACARFAIVERPHSAPDVPVEIYQLREVCSALQAQSKHLRRLTTQLHHRLACAFPEFALLASDLSATWVLRLLSKYPTPEKIKAARLSSLTAIPYLDEEQAKKIQAAASQTTAALSGPAIEELIRQLVAAIQQGKQAEKRLKKAMGEAFDALPPSNHVQLASIQGIGKQTAAALVAKMVSIDRFDSPAAVVSFFGIFPEENTSGVDKTGQPIVHRGQHMSQKGNDLVRSLLYMAAQSALLSNPAVRSVYARQKARGKSGAVALGHCMRKLLHLVFAVWKSGKPFNKDHYPWEDRQETEAPTPSGTQENVAGRNEQCSERKAVTATSAKIGSPEHGVNESTAGVRSETAPKPGRFIDFTELRRQVTMEQVLRHLGVFGQMRGGTQRRGPCPVHGSKHERTRSFSVNLQKHVFQCFHPPCAAKGNVLDLWAAVHRLPLHEAALNLAETFGVDTSQNREDGTR